MVKRLIVPALLMASLLGCGQEEKVDDRFNQAFEAQGKRMQGKAPADVTRGQALPPGTTPPPGN